MGLADVIVFEAPLKTDPPPLLTPDCIKIYGYVSPTHTAANAYEE